MLKTVNLQNVKTIRGGNNSGDVYRIVFDLNYLKHFSVQAKGNLLQVEFFDAPQLAAASPGRAPRNQDSGLDRPGRSPAGAEERTRIDGQGGSTSSRRTAPLEAKAKPLGGQQ